MIYYVGTSRFKRANIIYEVFLLVKSVSSTTFTRFCVAIGLPVENDNELKKNHFENTRINLLAY